MVVYYLIALLQTSAKLLEGRNILLVVRSLPDCFTNVYGFKSNFLLIMLAANLTRIVFDERCFAGYKLGASLVSQHTNVFTPPPPPITASAEVSQVRNINNYVYVIVIL